MLILSKTNAEEVVRLSMRERRVDALLDCEWLLTNGRGGYAASTVLGCNTSGYHGLLIGSLHPPVSRVMALSNCLEMVICGAETFELSTFAFGEKLAPAGYTHLREFWRDTGAHFLFDLGHIQVEKAVYLLRDSDTLLVEYTFGGVQHPVDFVLRPFVGLRDFHHLQQSETSLVANFTGPGVLVRHETPGSCGLLMQCPEMAYENDPQWWFNFTYRVNTHRGQHDSEDLWTPGFFKTTIQQDGRVVFAAHLGPEGHCEWPDGLDVDAVKSDLARHQAQVLRQAGPDDKSEAALVLAADKFVGTRGCGEDESSTIVAGYPWFADWGRDAFISLPGLLLTTGRDEEARSVLSTFAAVVDEGMIPNCFDDRSTTAHFNSVDASLWFVHGAFQYLEATGDKETFADELLPAIRSIIDAYQQGTRFGIHADADGLILAGDEQTQLTWMDARCNGVTFTPRWGKTVEVNALWHNALCYLHEYCLYGDFMADAQRYATMAQQVGESFCSVFWNEQRGYLNDTVRLGGEVDTRLRPNQIFAVSLPYGPPLKRSQQRAIVSVVEKALLTPYGLRTLDRRDEAYQGRYEGPQMERDAAYHQGTVWPYLMGPFVEAYLKVNSFKPGARRKAGAMIAPLLEHLTADGCLGSIAEVFDGDEPQRPAGCLAQAWSVAELLRAYHLVQNGKS